MIRHGQSMANADTSIYNRVPDYRIPLTPLGLEQATAAGDRIRRELDGRQVCVYVSPYLRAHQTLEALNLGNLTERVIEEPRLREQDWANFQISGEIEDQKELRNAYGHFFYRFREGESGSDVYDRISSFMETLYRHWSKPDYAPNTLLVTHGLTMRLFCMRWFHWSVEYFESPTTRTTPLCGPWCGPTRISMSWTFRSASGWNAGWMRPSWTRRPWCSSQPVV